MRHLRTLCGRERLVENWTFVLFCPWFTLLLGGDSRFCLTSCLGPLLLEGLLFRDIIASWFWIRRCCCLLVHASWRPRRDSYSICRTPWVQPPSWAMTTSLVNRWVDAHLDTSSSHRTNYAGRCQPGTVHCIWLVKAGGEEMVPDELNSQKSDLKYLSLVDVFPATLLFIPRWLGWVCGR